MVQMRLSALLGERRWTQADVSRMTGIRAATINLYYHDMAEHLPIDHIDLLCEALHCQVSELIIYIPNETPRITKDRRGQPINHK